ncbi:MAG TPA: Ig-like domain-containing protein, partial [Terriglobales bacterium]|nr:Ig-like domain-containing protein [Terriglobales bacterium]
DDAAASALPVFPGALGTGTYRPSSYVHTQSGFGEMPAFAAPAPAGPYTTAQMSANDGTATFASVFNGTDPNGTWNLFVQYQPQIPGAPVDNGTLTGWSLTITPQFTFSNPTAIPIPSAGHGGVYPSTISVSGLPGHVTKATVTLNSFTSVCQADPAFLLVGPQGQNLVLVSESGGCTSSSATVSSITLDDAAAATLPAFSFATPNFAAGTYKPTSNKTNVSGTPPTFSGVAGPYNEPAIDGSATLASLFNGVDPNGTWSLYAITQFGAGASSLDTGWSLTFQTDCPAGSNCAVNSNANPSVFGQPVGLTATVSSSSGTPFSPPQVTYLDGVSNLATINLNGSGQSLVTDSAFTIGTHPITVNYPGNTTFASCTSATLNQVVNKANTTTSLGSSLNPSVFGASVTFTATVTASAPGAGTPTGTVTFNDGGVPLTAGTVALSGSTATYTTSALAVGSHNITAVYNNDADFNGSTSATLTQTVNKDATTSSVGSSVNPSVFGNSVIFTAKVTAVAPGSGTPTGTATFFDGVTSLGPGTLDINGKATLSTAALAVGSHSITASYSGDGNFNASTSPAITQTVNPGTTTTSVGTSGTPSVFGNSVTFTATVVVATGAGTPTGTVTFKDGATTLGSGAVNGSGHATFATALLAAGGHSITAVYNGDANFTGSTSAAFTQTVNQGTTTTVVGTSGTPSTYGSSVTFTATVAEVSGSGLPTGTVTFFDGVTTLGGGTLNGGGVATFSTSTLTAGSHSITAVYNGDANLTGSTSPAITQVVNQATTTVNLISSQNPSLFGHPVIFTATVSPQFSGTPTGTVTVLDTTTRIILGTGTLDINGRTTVSTSSLAQGSHDITATYNADPNFTTSTSATLTQVVNALPVPTISLTSHPNPAGFKQQVILTATVSSVSGTPTGTVTFMDGARTMGTVSLTAGTATMTTNQWNIGSHQLTAVYNGDFNFGSGSSSIVVQLRTPKPH